MRRMKTLNTIYHSIGYLLVCIGWIICLGVAGNSDLGMDLSLVMRYAMCGMAMMLIGFFLTRWRV
jgi:hypothetical protein